LASGHFVCDGMTLLSYVALMVRPTWLSVNGIHIKSEI